jgi:hypothetical protein
MSHRSNGSPTMDRLRAAQARRTPGGTPYFEPLAGDAARNLLDWLAADHDLRRGPRNASPAPAGTAATGSSPS